MREDEDEKEKEMKLSELKSGETGVIVKVRGHGSFRKRVMEMGFVRGKAVKTVLYAPLQDPIKYLIMGYEVSLRRSEADLIEVVELSDENIDEILVRSDEVKERYVEDDVEYGRFAHHGREINVALIGNPNCGKTSLFNIASGSSEHVGNYSGVTVDAKAGKFEHKGYKFNIVDLPGTYSLASYSPEERYVRDYLRDQAVDVIVNVVDASNLERNMYLTTELIDMDRMMVIALNMYDEVSRDGTKLDYKLLGDMIGVPIVPTVSRTGTGIDELFDTVISVYEGKNESVRHIHVNLGAEIEEAIRVLRAALSGDVIDNHQLSTRFLAIKLLEKDTEVDEFVNMFADGKEILKLRDKELEKLQQKSGEDVNETIAAEKYGFIAGALNETLSPGKGRKNGTTGVIDSLVTSRILGFPLFFCVMFVTFWLTFALGQYPMDWIQYGVDALSGLVNKVFPDGIVKDLVADGIIGGVGGVIVFLPNILILYFCLSFMEDTGYMARAAFIMDKVMHRIGLHGKSFIPLVMGFGCNVPAILASRTIESRSSRIITILINPFMSCSARLPLYVLLIGTFFAKYAALVFFGLYIAGIAVAVVSAKLLRKFIFKKDETPFVMELPPYRVPTMRSLVRHTWGKGAQYLRKMGGLILVASIIVWALNYFPLNRTEAPAEERTEISTEHDSYLEMAGKAINPIMEPLGFNWRSTVAALAGVPAKEIVVSTLGVLYTDTEAVDDVSLGHRLEEVNAATGKPDFTPLKAMAFMIFILLYCPCIATVAAITRETRSWRYGAFTIVYNTVVAWLAAFAVYQIGMLL